jgi:hypothetical protein
MPWQPRRLRLENLEGRRLLAAVNIPDDLTAEVGAQVSAPVLIDTAQDVRGAEIRIQYDPNVLTLTPENVTAGTAWGAADDTQVVANVDQATGTVIVFVSAAEGLPNVGGSLVVFAFGVRETAPVGTETVVDLVQVRLNEGAIVVNPTPVPGADPTDGRIVITQTDPTDPPGPADRISGFVYADTNNDNMPGPLEGIPGVEVTLINLQTNAQQRTVTNSVGAFEFTGLTSGNYRIVQTQPLAYLDGGPNELNVQLPVGGNLTNQNFRELGLRPQFVYNRLLTTTALPIGSPTWIEVLRQINVDAASGTTAPANYSTTPTNSAASALSSVSSQSESSESSAAALMAQSEPIDVTSQSIAADDQLTSDNQLTTPPSSPEGESLAESDLLAESDQSLESEIYVMSSASTDNVVIADAPVIAQSPTSIESPTILESPTVTVTPATSDTPVVAQSPASTPTSAFLDHTAIAAGEPIAESEALAADDTTTAEPPLSDSGSAHDGQFVTATQSLISDHDDDENPYQYIDHVLSDVGLW